MKRRFILSTTAAVATVAVGLSGCVAAPGTQQAAPQYSQTTADSDLSRRAAGLVHIDQTSKKKKKKAKKSGSCKASYYSYGSRTANGERFKPNKLTAAHKSFKFGTKVKVTNKKNGKSVTVRINDRGPFVKSRCLDLSKGAMKKLKGTKAGVIKVKYKVVKAKKKK
mgnify:CR=1 FL=1